MTEPVQLKYCPDCTKEKPEVEFHLRSNGKRNTYCIPCHRERGYRNKGYTPKLRREDRPKVTEGEFRVCTKCKTPQKVTDDFYFLKNENRRAWACKTCYKIARIINEERKKYICHLCKQRVKPEGQGE